MKFIKKILNCVRENIFCVRDINKIKIFFNNRVKNYFFIKYFILWNYSKLF